MRRTLPRLLPLITKEFRVAAPRRFATPHPPTTMTTATAPLEGLLAINKPIGISSAEVIRQLQKIFKHSRIFHDTLEVERSRRNAEAGNQRRRRKKDSATHVEVKIGHGGTLDPMASGVLITGIGGGTKVLSQFLGCTKSYEATLMLGADTDTYDALGKVTAWAGWEDVTRERVEEALGQFQGNIMQKPPIYSALHMNGKRLYEYAREGKPLPVEIKARPVTTVSLSMVDFTYEHEYEFPKEEAPKEEMVLVQQLADGAKELKAEDVLKAVEANKIQENAREGVAAKEEVKEESVAKEEIKGETAPVVESTTKEDTAPEEIVVDQNESAGEKRARSASPEDSTAAKKHKSTTAASGKPPIITLRMSVTSGFYVRSLIHDLGLALGSAAHMVKLVRTRQADYELGSEKVMEWEELMEKPEEVWGPKVEGFLRKWAEEREAGRG